MHFGFAFGEDLKPLSKVKAKLEEWTGKDWKIDKEILDASALENLDYFVQFKEKFKAQVREKALGHPAVQKMMKCFPAIQLSDIIIS